MKQAEANHVLARMMTTWPQVELPDPTIELWIETITNTTFGRAEQVVKHLTQTCEWFPSFAAWHKAAKEITDYAPFGELAIPDEPHIEAEEGHRRINEMRNLLGRPKVKCCPNCDGDGEVQLKDSSTQCETCKGLGTTAA